MIETTLVLEGSDRFRAMLKSMGRSALPAIAEALHLEAEAVMEDAKTNYVPTVSTNLKGSGFVKPTMITPTGVIVQLGFGNASLKYAKRTHENPRAGKTRGVSPQGRRYRKWSRVGSWKFLTKPLKRRERGLEKRVWRTILTHWGPLLGGGR